jgi:hypothetical protein
MKRNTRKNYLMQTREGPHFNPIRILNRALHFWFLGGSLFLRVSPGADPTDTLLTREAGASTPMRSQAEPGNE